CRPRRSLNLNCFLTDLGGGLTSVFGASATAGMVVLHYGIREGARATSDYSGDGPDGYRYPNRVRTNLTRRVIASRHSSGDQPFAAARFWRNPPGNSSASTSLT